MPGIRDMPVINAIKVHKTGYSAADIPDLTGKVHKLHSSVVCALENVVLIMVYRRQW